jgi:hypothetical protein
MIHFISHRGNTNGPIPELENKPSYILETISKGFDVEIDVRYNKDIEEFWLGHDKPQYKVDLSFLKL